MVAAILVAGIWGIWKALVQRRYTETAGALAVSVLFVLIALFFVYQPERTIGEASRWTNTLSLAFLSGANRGSLDDPQQAKRQVADHLFETLVYRPWVVLEFGGLRHCVDTDRLDEDGFPRPVGPHDPARDVCRDHLQPGSRRARRLRATVPAPAGRVGGAQGRVRGAAQGRGTAGSTGSSPATGSTRPTRPAVDIQQAGGAFQRLTFAVDRVPRRARRGRAARLPGAGGDPGPGRRAGAARVRAGRAGHRDLPGRRARVLPQLADQARHRGLHQGAVLAGDRDRGRRLGRAGRRRPTRSGSCSRSGCRRCSSGRSSCTASRSPRGWSRPPPAPPTGRSMPRTTVVQRGAHIAARPFSALVGVSRSRGERHAAGERARRRRRHARTRTRRAPQRPRDAVAGAAAHRQRPFAAARGGSNGNGHAPAAGDGSNGNGRAVLPTSGDPLPANGVAGTTGGASAAVAAAPARRRSAAPAAALRGQRDSHAPEPSPRASHEDVMRRARELREQSARRRAGGARVVDRLRAFLNRPLRDSDRPRLFALAVARDRSRRLRCSPCSTIRARRAADAGPAAHRSRRPRRPPAAALRRWRRARRRARRATRRRRWRPRARTSTRPSGRRVASWPATCRTRYGQRDAARDRARERRSCGAGWRASGRASRPRERRRRPRLVLLQADGGRPVTRGAARAGRDGARRYTVPLELERTAAGWRVTDARELTVRACAGHGCRRGRRPPPGSRRLRAGALWRCSALLLVLVIGVFGAMFGLQPLQVGYGPSATARARDPARLPAALRAGGRAATTSTRGSWPRSAGSRPSTAARARPACARA